MGRLTAFLDASVLYSAPLRDLLLELAVSDPYRAKWSEAVHDEWMAALLRARPDLSRERPKSAEDYLDILRAQGLRGTVEAMVPFTTLL